MTKYTVSFQMLGLRSDLQQDLLQVDLFGPAGQISILGLSSFEQEMVPGVYRARISGGWGTRDTLFVIEPKANQNIELDVPLRFSSAPMPDAIGHHEYYIASFIERGLTRDPLNVGDEDNSPHLFFYLRMRDELHAQQYMQQHGVAPKLFQGLKLLDQEGRCLTEFNDDEVHEIPDIGMARFRAKIAPGFYRLVYTDSEGKIEWLPLPVLAPSQYIWDTDVTMLWDGRPQFSTMSLFTPIMRSGDHCDLCDYDMQVNTIDTVIQTLATGQRVRDLKSETVRQLLSDKFANPMMGILGMHLYLLRDNLKPNNVKNILNNLQALAPGSPDVEALKVLAWEQGLISAPDRWQFSDIPLVRLGAMAMQRASVSGVDFDLPPHAEQLFIELNASSPWTQTGSSYQPALEKTEAKVFDEALLNFELPFVAEVQSMAGEASVEMIKPLQKIVNAQKELKVAPKSFSLRPHGEIATHDGENFGLPSWLTEALVKKVPQLRLALEKGQLDQSINQLAAQNEVLRPTVAKVVRRLLA